ncbi:MAG: hypothetical protein RLZ98_2037, partial [Pseudomonadota bacterium]
MESEKIKGKPDGKVAWGSDIAAQMLRRAGIKHVSLNPGASYRGLHDSLVNHLGNENPSMLVCMHEDHSVAIAHGYAKASGEPMACVLHANVGLMHGMMSLFNAWCDRVPMIVLGATGPVDAMQRRPWIDWIHTSQDQGALLRGMIKWDDQPSSPQGLVESMTRANQITRTAPSAPVYICLDAGLQELQLAAEPDFPDLARFAPPDSPRPSKAAIDKAADMLSGAKKIVMMCGRGSRTREAWDARIALAERLGACVMTDLKTGAMFPTDHPAHVCEPFNQVSPAAREILVEADVILALDWADLGGNLKATRSVGEVKAKIIRSGLDHQLHTGVHMEYQVLPPTDVFIGAEGDVVVAELLAALGPGSAQGPWRDRVKPKPKGEDETKVTMAAVASTLRAAFNDPDKVSFTALSRGWPSEMWPMRDPLAYIGKDGGGGIGSGPGISIGAALYLHEQGRYPVAVLGDGDFSMGVNAVWTAVHHKIPILFMINNNRAYYNDELHQETIAKRRNREVENAWVGQRLENPSPDLA